MAECRHTITEQHMKLGVSCDWTRERFTMDEGSSRAVRTAFVRLYEKGLIYRGERIINWCPRCGTALSDLEVDHQDVNGHLWYVRYPLVGEKGQVHHRGHHPPGDHPGRYGRGRQSRKTSALKELVGQESAPARRQPRDTHHRR